MMYDYLIRSVKKNSIVNLLLLNGIYHICVILSKTISVFKLSTTYLLMVLFFICIVNSSLQAQIQGKVFLDYDANGLQSTSVPLEYGVAGVKVRLFVANVSTPFLTQTDSKGEYSFSALQAPAGKNVRIEFYNLPSTFSNGLVGPNSNTEVQFVKAPASDINLGIFNDDEYCIGGNEIKIATACYVQGDPLKTGDAADSDALVIFNYNESGLAQNGDLEHLAYAREIGSTWIGTYQRSAGLLLVGAMTRRHVGLGPLGTGGFYTIDLKTKKVTPLVDVKKLGIDTGPDPHLDPVSQLNLLPAKKTQWSRDSLSFHAAGKVGIGGAQLSTTQDTLSLINLYDKKFYRFPVPKPMAPIVNVSQVAAQKFDIPHPNCSNNDYTPWALKSHRGKHYIGVVCTAEQSQKLEDLKAAVYEFNPATHQFRNLLVIPLTYSRGPIDNTPGCNTISRWLPWTNQFPKQCNVPDSVSAFLVHPQAILSDLEFDEDGSLFLGFMDRLGLQTGQDQPGIATNDTLHYYGFMSGDLLRAQYNADGSYTLENNAQSGDLLGCGANSNAGPGGGEFFCEDYWVNGNGAIGHAEITNGGLVKIAGIPEILTSAMDPVHGAYLSTGFISFDAKTGKRKNSFAIYSVSPGTLGKSGGVGDLAGICDVAPLEIGNLVWLDVNQNGIQDPDDTLMDGVVITLHDLENSGIEVGRDTTSSGGQYYFNDKNIKQGLKRNHSYEIRLGLKQTILVEELTITTKNQVSGVGSGLRDSDAELSSNANWAFIKIQTGDNSQTNHTVDFGLKLAQKPCSELCAPVRARVIRK